jgi:uncharacterized membrane protein
LFGIALMLLSTVLFFAMVTRMVDLLRIVRVCAQVGARALAYVAATHPRDGGAVPLPEEPPSARLPHVEPPAVLVDLDPKALARIAHRAGVRLVLTPALGEYVLPDRPLFQVWGTGKVNAWRVRRLVAFAEEHALSGRHPAAMLRVLVDIALKALSPAINDPTTASQTLDEIELVLVSLADRKLGRVTVTARDGTPVLDYRLPEWEDYVSLGTDEVRHFGATSVQVVRRLRALYAELLRHAPESRHAVVQRRIAALDETLARDFPDALDSGLGALPDRLGIGGPSPYPEIPG